ncbi:dynein assembly factor 5, axonemal [Drosophila eugracilis]|uniref:dynein assembly factor 5, axonemal n=1 Tax=Drosophila eugracilis TaxID=29029 RepID=UPI001BDA85CF|nr:dynein assembly factor 5, axonemal [Drosophila eugracilis]XP_041674804.1 dynein assembly factor 5, axonemal [Drosophila eugracilis]
MDFEIDTQKICEDLQGTDRRQKTTVLGDLRDKIKDSPKSVSTERLADIFDELYLHLLKSYHDRFESVRDHAVQAVNAFLGILPPMDFHLMNVVSTLAERMGQAETVEPSEEIRLQYISQLNLMVCQYAKMGNVGVFRECYPLVVKILIKSIKDEYPVVQREGCTTLVNLARVAESLELRPHIDSLLVALYGMLNHKHAQARISAVEAIGRLSLHMDASGEGMRRLFNEVSPLLMDTMPLVRREVGQMGILMLMELLDRYSFFERILPLVLCCLKDESPEVLNHIYPQWVECGKLYFNENEAELTKQEISDLPAENYPENVKRPTIGCRALVQRSLRLLSLITRETSDWKDNVRLHALKLLYQFVLHAEAAMTAKFFEIYGDLAHACIDPVAEVSAEAAKVADLMGRLLSYDAWIDHGFDGLERFARESYMRCFYHMFTSALGGTYDQLLKLAKLLRTTDYSHTLKPTFQLYILKLLDTIIDKSLQIDAGYDELMELYESVYVTAFKVMALSYSINSNGNEDVNRGQMLIERIVDLEKTTIAKIHERWFHLALKDVENLDAALEENSEPVMMLDGLINMALIRDTYFADLMEKVKLVFEHCCDSAQVKIFSSLSVATLFWSKTMNVERERSTQILSEFVSQIVEPYLTWKAGSNAEAMRSLAMATLCALAQGAESESAEVLPSLAKHMPGLLEDRNVTTRHYAIKAVVYFRDMSVEDLKPLAYATMQRMDDPSAGIRVLAALAVGKLKPKFSDSETEAEHEKEVWDAFVKRAMDLMLLYHESPEKDIRNSVEVSLKVLVRSHPEAWAERFPRALAMAQKKDQLNELFNRLTIEEETEPED